MARLKAHTAHSANTLFTTSLVFFRYVAAPRSGANPLTMAHLASFRSSLSKKDLPRSTSVNNAIRFWASLGLPGVTDDALAYAVDAEKSHHITGRAVRTRCPISQPCFKPEYDGNRCGDRTYEFHARAKRLAIEARGDAGGGGLLGTDQVRTPWRRHTWVRSAGGGRTSWLPCGSGMALVAAGSPELAYGHDGGRDVAMGVEAGQFGERPLWRGARDRAAVITGAMRQDGDQPQVGLSARGQQWAPGTSG